LGYLKKAIRAKGRTPSSKWPALARLIRANAKRLGATNAPGVKGTWAFSNEMILAGSVPVASASDGPRIVSAAGSKLGLQPHQVKAYARFRKRGATHAAALTFARRVRSRANEMGSAAAVGSGTGSKAYSRDMDFASMLSGSQASAFRTDTPASSARGSQLTSKTKARTNKGTRQGALLVPQSIPRGARSGGSEGNPRKSSMTRSTVGSIRSSSATPPGGKLLKSYTPGNSGNRATVSAGRYNWPDNKGQGSVPRTPVSTGAGFKTPSNLKVNTLMDENASSIRVSGTTKSQQAPYFGSKKAKIAYGKLRGMGISHASAAHVVNQYMGSGRPKNSLGLNKGGSLTNLRMKQSAGRGASSPSPKGV